MIVLIAIAVLYTLVHGHHYKKRRRAGFGVWESLPGPFGTRVTVSKRWRL